MSDVERSLSRPGVVRPGDAEVRTSTVLVRPFGAELSDSLLTYVDRHPLNVARARAQHEAFVRTLESLGAVVESLPACPASPDAVFVEDTAVVLDEVAVVCRPAEASRRPELESVVSRVGRERPLVGLSGGATLEGGDVVRSGRHLFVGRSGRTNDAGICALAAAAVPHGYDVTVVTVRGALHLKTAATALPDGSLVANPDWLDVRAFGDVEVTAVDPDEPWGANTLSLGDVLLCADDSPRTNARLGERGLSVHELGISEFRKAEGGVSCLALVIGPARSGRPGASAG